MTKSSKGRKAKKGKSKKAQEQACLETTTPSSGQASTSSSDRTASTPSKKDGPSTPEEWEAYHKVFKGTVWMVSQGLGMTTSAVEKRYEDANKGLKVDIKLFKAYFEVCAHRVCEMLFDPDEEKLKKGRQVDKGKAKEKEGESEDDKFGYVFHLAICLAYQGLADKGGTLPDDPEVIKKRIEAAIPTLGANDRLFYEYFKGCTYKSAHLYRIGGPEIRAFIDQDQSEKKKEDRQFEAMYGVAQKWGFFDVD